MKSLIRIFLIVFISFYSTELYSLSNHKIIEICKKERNKLSCMKELKKRRSDLNEGKPIEIEIVPY